jgi:peptidoglycan hydrolase CwlO-like protein
MDTPMLKRRLNPFLLVSTVLILSLLAGLTVLYQGTLADVNDQKKQLKQEVKQSEQEIKQLEADKKNLTRQIRDKEDEISRLNSLLDSKEQEVQQLAQRITTLENQLDQASSTSNTTEQINNTLGRICLDEESQLSSDARTLCNFRGHETS